MEKSDSISELAKALSAFQGELKPVKKDATNPFFKSKYADLAGVWEVCRGLLAKNGLSLTQLPYIEGDKIILTTVLLHTSGEWLSSNLLVTPMKPNDPQSVGSALTYARRYAMGAMLGVAAEEEDDDAETASGRGQALRTKTQPSAKPSTVTLDGTRFEFKDKVDETSPAKREGLPQARVPLSNGEIKAREILKSTRNRLGLSNRDMLLALGKALGLGIPLPYLDAWIAAGRTIPQAIEVLESLEKEEIGG